MSFFKRLIGSESTKSKAQKISTSEQAIEQLDSVEDILVKRQEHLEQQIEDEKKNAITRSRQGNKRGALIALRKKKQHEKVLAQIDGTLTTIEMQRDTLINAKNNAEIFRVIQGTSKALQKVHADLNIDQVNDIMDDLDEQNQLANQISTALSSPASSNSLYDQDDLERELELLAAEDNVEPPVDISRLPNVPETSARSKATADDYRQLEAWMS